MKNNCCLQCNKVTLTPISPKDFNELKHLIFKERENLKTAFPFISNIDTFIQELKKINLNTNYMVLKVLNQCRIIIGIIILEKKKDKVILYYFLGSRYKCYSFTVVKEVIRYLENAFDFKKIETYAEETMFKKCNKKSFLEKSSLNFKKQYTKKSSGRNKQVITFSKKLCNCEKQTKPPI